MKKQLVGLCIYLCATVGNAAVIAFVPPNDVSGQVFSTNNNDGWSSGRGLVFQMTANKTINSIGLFEDLSGISLSYELARVTSATGLVTIGQTILASGVATVTTTGLQWIDFGIANTLLSAGNSYHLQFIFSGNGNQNFFHDNRNVAFSQGSFASIDGTASGDTGNSVMPKLRLTTTISNVPIPSTAWLFGSGFLGLFGVRRNRC